MEFILDIASRSVSDIMKEIGYQSCRFTKNGEFSMTRCLATKGKAQYPRFYLWGKHINSHTIFRLHLDLAKHGITGEKQNSEYHGDAVRIEAERIAKILRVSADNAED